MLDILVQTRRNKQVAKKFFRKLLKGSQYAPRTIITDELGSYTAISAEILQRSHTYRTNDQTIGQRICISPCGNGSVGCEALNQSGMLRGYLRAWGLSLLFLALDGICWRQATIVKSCGDASCNVLKSLIHTSYPNDSSVGGIFVL